MCFSATCPTCSKKSWRGCGSHIPEALSGVPEDQWCTCGPPIMIGRREYPPAAKFEIPGISWLAGLFEGGGAAKKGDEAKGDQR